MLKQDRIRSIEERCDAGIKTLLRDLHYVRDFKHKQIARLLGVPRPTITRWFREFNIPTRSCHRFTNQNLTSWLYKTGTRKKKARYNGPDRRIQQSKGNVNIDFFKHWSEEMAYVLGFFAADGGMFINSGGSRYIQFVSTDKEILIKIKRLMRSKHKIGIKKKTPGSRGKKVCYVIQIGSKAMYSDLLKLGFRPKKDLRIKLPKIPNHYFRHFVRGYFDGDGFVTCGWYKRKNRQNKKYFLCQTGFTCGNKVFLSDLSNRLTAKAGMGNGSIRSKPRSWDLLYSKRDTIRLANYMYKENISNSFLERKYNKVQEIFKILGDVA